MARVVETVLSILILFFGGFGGGYFIASYQHPSTQQADPLRQDSPHVEAWLAANIRGDAQTMWDNSSSDYQDKYPGGKEQFLKDNTHAPSPTPPKITFQASVKLMGFGSEMFYILTVGNGERMTLPLYTDDEGRFDGFAS